MYTGYVTNKYFKRKDKQHIQLCKQVELVINRFALKYRRIGKIAQQSVNYLFYCSRVKLLF